MIKKHVCLAVIILFILLISSNNVNANTETPIDENIINYDMTVQGDYINQTTGTFEKNSLHRRSEIIPCKSSQVYIFGYINKSTGVDISKNVAFRYAFYDANKVYIEGTLNINTFTSPSNAAYIAVSWLSTLDADYNIQLKEKTATFPVTSKPSNIIFDENFKNDIPKYLANSGNFIIDDGLISPSVTGYDKQIYFNEDIALDKEKIYVDFTPTTANTKIGVGFRSAITGLLCEVDFENNKLRIRNTWSNPISTIPPTIFLEKSLTFTPELNRKYSVILEKDTRKNISITVKDTVSLESTKLDLVEEGTVSPTNAWGGACIIAISGNFKVNKFTFLNNQPSTPVLAIYGDSFVEGTTIMPNIEQRYAAKVKESLNGDCIIGGKGGETTSGLLSKIEIYSKFRPKYTLLAVGSNDTVFSDYKTNIESLIKWCENMESIPVLTTITRNMAHDNLTYLQQVNNYVRNSGYRYIDFAAVMSESYDGETQNTDLFLPDKVHPNLAGHEIMYEKFIADLPEIFDID